MTTFNVPTHALSSQYIYSVLCQHMSKDEQSELQRLSDYRFNNNHRSDNHGLTPVEVIDLLDALSYRLCTTSVGTSDGSLAGNQAYLDRHEAAKAKNSIIISDAVSLASAFRERQDDQWYDAIDDAIFQGFRAPSL